MKLVKVEWVDACTVGQQWKNPKGTNYKPERCISVGYVIRKTKKYIVVVPHINPQKTRKMVCGEMVILRCVITKIKKLK